MALQRAPGLVGAAVWWRFTLAPTARMPVRPEQQEVLDGARRWSFRADGLELPGWAWGEGPTVLLVHGWAGRAAQLAAFVPPLVAAGFSVATFDGPACGTAPGTHTSMLHLGQAVAAAGRALGPLHGVVAHSMGAGASIYALRLGLDAERLALVAPATDPVRYFDGATRALGLSALERAQLRQAVEVRAGTPFERLVSAGTLARHPRPVLVVHDHDDREVPVDEGRAVADVVPDARLVLTRGLGHNRLLADPDVVEAARAFLQDGRAHAWPASELAYGRG